jgi:hypothetical protein
MAKRKTATQPHSDLPADDEIVHLTAEPPKENPAADTTPPLTAQSSSPAPRQPGDDTPPQQAAEPRKAGWAPRTTIAVPLTEEAKRDHTKGEVARYIDGYNSGVGARIDSPDPAFRPSDEVKEPLKEEHPHRESMRWNKEQFHKKTIGKRQDGRERSPVGERLDAEERFEDMVERRKSEIGKTGGGKVPF